MSLALSIQKAHVTSVSEVAGLLAALHFVWSEGAGKALYFAVATFAQIAVSCYSITRFQAA